MTTVQRATKAMLTLGGASILLAMALASGDKPERNVKDLPRVPAAQLYAEYASNEVAADNKYKGKTIIVTGMVEKIGKDLTDDTYVALATGQMIFSVQCFFDAGHEAELAKVAIGNMVALTCDVRGKMANILLKDCEFTK